jgi:hypothetical protein
VLAARLNTLELTQRIDRDLDDSKDVARDDDRSGGLPPGDFIQTRQHVPRAAGRRDPGGDHPLPLPAQRTTLLLAALPVSLIARCWR